MPHHRMARYCIVLALLAPVLLVLGTPVGRLLPFALALACPLMMVFMMRRMHGRQGDHTHDEPGVLDPSGEDSRLGGW